MVDQYVRSSNDPADPVSQEAYEIYLKIEYNVPVNLVKDVYKELVEKASLIERK